MTVIYGSLDQVSKEVDDVVSGSIVDVGGIDVATG
jgi:hypothetical protein